MKLEKMITRWARFLEKKMNDILDEYQDSNNKEVLDLVSKLKNME